MVVTARLPVSGCATGTTSTEPRSSGRSGGSVNAPSVNRKMRRAEGSPPSERASSSASRMSAAAPDGFASSSAFSTWRRSVVADDQHLWVGGDEDRGGQRVLGQAAERFARRVDRAARNGSGWTSARLHAGRAVDQQDRLDGPLAFMLGERARHGEADQRQRQQLQQQQQAPLQPLQRLVRRQIANQVVPQERRRHLLVVAAHLEQVEDDDDRQRDAERQRQRREQVHRTTPRRRRTSKTSVSSGTAVSMARTSCRGESRRTRPAAASRRGAGRTGGWRRC